MSQSIGETVIALRDVDPTLLDLADRVCEALLCASEALKPSDIMLVGAHCRDILQASHGHTFGLRTTDDVDFGIALADWAAFTDLTANLNHTGHSGVRFNVAGVPIDLMPFGPVENPAGVVTPQPRDEPMSVWAFQEVFELADTLALPSVGRIRIPTIPGYVALKLAAWLDRSECGDYKDAGDLAAAMHWYANSDNVLNRLYADDAGADVLVLYDVDPTRSAIHLLGCDVADLLGTDRHKELSARWPGERGDLLPVEMNLPTVGSWPTHSDRRLERLSAFENGLGVKRTQIQPDLRKRV